jgi:hypothetical protein
LPGPILWPLRVAAYRGVAGTDTPIPVFSLQALGIKIQISTDVCLVAGLEGRIDFFNGTGPQKGEQGVQATSAIFGIVELAQSGDVFFDLEIV